MTVLCRLLRWYATIFPRLGRGGLAGEAPMYRDWLMTCGHDVAGFEFATGIFSNANKPIADAELLRAVELPQDQP